MATAKIKLVGVTRAQRSAAIAKAASIAKAPVTLPWRRNNSARRDSFSGARVLIKPAAPGTVLSLVVPVRQIIGVTSVVTLLVNLLAQPTRLTSLTRLSALKSLVPRDQPNSAQPVKDLKRRLNNEVQ